MSKKAKKLLQGKFNWQESYPSLILGAIIVVVLGLLVANYFSRRSMPEISTGEQTEQTQQTLAQPTAGAKYTVKENDSLSKISEQVYGSQDMWPQIAKANNITTPNKILVGSTLDLPAKEAVAQISAEMTQTSYEVKDGETLFTIAEKVYGDGSKWIVLHKANGGRYLKNGNPLVYSGTTISIPR